MADAGESSGQKKMKLIILKMQMRSDSNVFICIRYAYVKK